MLLGGEKKKKNRKEKEKRKGEKTHMSLSLKINEKIGNPRVTAWEKRKSILLSIHLGHPESLKRTKVVKFVANTIHLSQNIFKNKLAGETGE